MNHTNQRRNNSFVLQGFILASASIIVRLIGLFYRIPLTNILGDTGVGLYGYAFEVYNIALLLSSYSLPLAVSKMVSARVTMGERKNAYRVLKITVVLATIVGALVAIGIYFGADYIAGTLMKAPMSSYALKMLSPCLFIVAVLGVLRGYCQGVGTNIPTALSQILEQIVNAIVSLVAASYFIKMGIEIAESQNNELLPSGYGAAGGTMGTVMGALTALIFMIFVVLAYRKILMKQIKKEHRVQEEPYSHIIQIVLLTVLPVIFSTLIYNIHYIIDQSLFNNVMVQQGMIEKDYYALWGMYNGKYNILLNVPMGIANAFATSVIPSLTAAAVAKNRPEIKRKIGLAIRVSMLIAIPSSVAFIALGKPILDLLFSGDNMIPARIMMIGSLAVIFFCLSTITNGILQGIDKMTVPIKNAFIALVVHVIFLVIFLMIFKLNIYGVILSSVIFAFTMCILNCLAIRKYVKYRQEYQRTFILPLISAMIMGLVAFVVYFALQFAIGSNWAIIIAMGLAVAVYSVALVKTGAMPEDDIYDLPKGAQLVKLLKKIHLV